MMDLSTTTFDCLIGRQRELGILRRRLQQAAEGAGRFVLISGEAGTGKTSLIRQLEQEVEQKGGHFLSESFAKVRSYEPYAPFVRIVEKLCGSAAEPLLSQSVANRHVRESHVKDGSDGQVWDTELYYALQREHGLVRQRLASALFEIARHELVVLALHHVHLAPLTAWQFIHYLCERFGEHRILLLVTLRLDGREVRRTKIPIYADVLQRMNREGLVERIELNRFSVAEIRELLHHRFPRSDFSSRLLPLLHRISGGIPQQVVRCVELMQERGLIFEQGGVWFDREEELKNTLAELIRDDLELQNASQQLQDLTPEQRQILHVAALMDAPFDPTLLSMLTERSRLQVIRDLIALTQRKILRNVDDDLYLFKRSAIRSAVIDEIPENNKEALHRAIATAIAGADHIKPAEKTFLLAYHYRHTNDNGQAFRHLSEAGKLAVSNFAFPEAREYYREALSLLQTVPEAAAAVDQVRMLLQAGWLDRVLGYWDESLAHCQAALDLCHGKETAGMKNQALIQAGLTYFRLNDWAKAQESFQRCLESDEDSVGFDKAMANYGLGNVHFELGDYELSRRYYNEALERARRIDSQYLMANIFNNLGAVENVSGRHLQAIALYSQSIPLHQKLGDNFGLARVYHNIGMTYADERQWQEANRFYGKSLSVSDVMGLVPLKSITFLNRALALAHLHRFDEAREYNFKARRLLRKLRDDLGMAEYHKIQGMIEREQGNLSESKREFEKALEKYDSMQNRLGRAETEYERGLLAVALGERKEGIQWLQKAMESYSVLGLPAKAEAIRAELASIQSRSQTPSSPDDEAQDASGSLSVRIVTQTSNGQRAQEPTNETDQTVQDS